MVKASAMASKPKNKPQERPVPATTTQPPAEPTIHDRIAATDALWQQKRRDELRQQDAWTERTLHVCRGGRVKEVAGGRVVIDTTPPPSFEVVGTSSGRTQCATPNMKAMPKTEGVGELGGDVPNPVGTEPATGGRYSLYGHPATAVLRWMGKEGLTVEQAERLLQSHGLGVSGTTVRIQIRAGKTGDRGDPAALTHEQRKDLLSRAVLPAPK